MMKQTSVISLLLVVLISGQVLISASPSVIAYDPTLHTDTSGLLQPYYQVTVRNFLAGWITNLSFGYKTISFDATHIFLIKLGRYRFDIQWYGNGEHVSLKQTEFQGIMSDQVLCGISRYTYSIH
ncbi:MAG: hypothetical protein JXA00_02145 [Candidatus Thermoplasmatota archaeon]|nr:hypothetical protein [Candidatus Thermoplasmatota archaeon]